VTYTKKGAREKAVKFSLVEIKYGHELNEFKDEFAPKFKVAETYCNTKGGKLKYSTRKKSKPRGWQPANFFIATWTEVLLQG
jgi:hypothetical protein